MLVEDGSPAAGLWVILTGSMELVHEGEPIQVLEPGECFGHPSLLTGMAPDVHGARARAVERARCSAPTAGRRLLGTEAGAAYVAVSMRKRLTDTGHTVHGLLDVGTTPVSAIMRPATFCDPGRVAARRRRPARRDGVSALLVRLDDGRLGILTDADVRSAVAVDGVPLDAPVRAAARTPVPTVPADQLAIEATVEMLAAGSRAPGRDRRRPDVRGAVGHRPARPRCPQPDRAAPRAARRPDEDALTRAAGQIPKLFLLLARAGVPPRDLGRVAQPPARHDGRRA